MTYFRVGEGTAVVAGRSAAFVRALPSSPLAEVLVDACVRSAPFEEIVSAITRLGFVDLPPFAIAVFEPDGAHVLQRGDVELRVLLESDHLTVLPAPRATTWREEFFDAVAEISMGSLDESLQEYWCTDGCVAASHLRVLASQRQAIDGHVQFVMPAASSAPIVAAAAMAVELEEPIEVDESVDVEEPEEEVESTPPAEVPSLEPAEEVSVDASPAEEVPAAEAPMEAAPAVTEASEVLETPESEPDSTLVFGGTPTPAVDPSPSPLTSLTAQADAGDLDLDDLVNLVDHTVYRDVESAAMREPDPNKEAAAPTPLDGIPAGAGAATAAVVADDDPDHDGHTVMRRPSGAPTAAPAMAVATTANGPQVQALRCPSQHPNPVGATHCRECGQAITDRSAVTIPRPRLGVLRFSTQEVMDLSGPALIGRQPPTDGQVDGESAIAMRIDHSELSRSHATVHVTDWHVHVSDNGSTNGTKVMVPGQPAEACRPQQRLLITPGTVVDLGGVVTFRYDLV